MDLFAGMNVSAGSTQPAAQAQPAHNPEPQQVQAQQQPSGGSQMPGLFAGMNFGAPQQTSTPVQQTQATQAPKPASSLGSAFGIQIGALSNPAPPTAQTIAPTAASEPPKPQGGLGLFAGLGVPPQQQQPQAAQTSASKNSYISPLSMQQQDPIPNTAQAPAPQQQAEAPEEDPFEAMYSRKPANTATPQVQASGLGNNTSQDNTNQSFEEIKKQDVSGVSQDANKSGGEFQFRINNKVVNQNEIAGTMNHQPPPKKSFFKSAFNFVAGGFAGGQKQAYAPQIPQQKEQKPALKQTEVGGVTIIQGSQGTGISESDAPFPSSSNEKNVVDQQPSPIQGRQIQQSDQEKAMNNIPKAQTSSFNFMGQQDANTENLKPPQHAAPEPQVPYYGPPQEPGSGNKKSVLDSFMQQNNQVAQPVAAVFDAQTTQVEQANTSASQGFGLPGTQTPAAGPAGGSLFDFMNKSLSSNSAVQQSSLTEATVPVQQRQWGPGSNSAELPPVVQQSSGIEPAAPSGDLFSMLNLNISTTSTQNNQVPGSAFGFVQNQSSLNMSNKSDTTLQPVGAQTGQNPTGAQMVQVEDPEDFVELSDSREIIEDRIFRIKFQMIDLTIMQQNYSIQQETLEADIKILEAQRYEALRNEAKAAEREDYDEAEKLNLKIQSIRQLIAAKDAQRRKLDEDRTSIESRKGDKFVELGHIVEKSKAKLNADRDAQQTEMNSYEETEQLAVDEKKKRLHYERIRITEDTEEMRQSRESAEKIEHEIDEQVYDDTKDQHIEKHRLDNEVEDLDQEIQALEQQLTQKRKARETLVLEKNVYEKQIALARSKYQTKINKQASMMDKIQKKEQKLEQDSEDYKREIELLAEYEEHFKSKLAQFEQELDDIAQLEIYLNRAGERISITLNEKKSCMESQFTLKQEKNGLCIKLQNQQDAMDHRNERIAVVDTQIEDTNNQLQQIEQRKLKVETEKKKFASQRKFKEASTCQAQLKQLQQSAENYDKFKNDYLAKKNEIEVESADKNEELKQIEERIADLTKLIEREHQKYLIYRIYDCTDMIKVLRPFCNDGSSKKEISSLMVNALSEKEAKEKRHQLEQEQIKMQKELLELDLKYGTYEVELPQDFDDEVQEQISEVQTEQENVVEDIEEAKVEANEEQAAQKDEDISPVETSVEKQVDVKEEIPLAEPKIQETKDSVDTADDNIPTMTAAQLTRSLQELTKKLTDLENKIEEAVEQDDFEQADILQQQIEQAEILKTQYESDLERLGGPVQISQDPMPNIQETSTSPSELKDQPQVPAYDAPSEEPQVPSYETPAASQVPQVPSYGASEEPQVPSYGAPEEPQVPSYDAPASSEPQVPSYGAPEEPQVSKYGSDIPQYGQPTTSIPQYGAANQETEAAQETRIAAPTAFGFMLGGSTTAAPTPPPQQEQPNNENEAQAQPATSGFSFLNQAASQSTEEEAKVFEQAQDSTTTTSAQPDISETQSSSQTMPGLFAGMTQK